MSAVRKHVELALLKTLKQLEEVELELTKGIHPALEGISGLIMREPPVGEALIKELANWCRENPTTLSQVLGIFHDKRVPIPKAWVRSKSTTERILALLRRKG